MTKTGNVLAVGLLVLFFAAAGSAFAAGPTSLLNTTWTGDITSITTAGGLTAPPNAFSINFKTESSDTDFLSPTSAVGIIFMDFAPLLEVSLSASC